MAESADPLHKHSTQSPTTFKEHDDELDTHSMKQTQSIPSVHSPTRQVGLEGSQSLEANRDDCKCHRNCGYHDSAVRKNQDIPEDKETPGHASMQQVKKGPSVQKKRLFGLAQERHVDRKPLDDDYEALYIPDELGQEMGPDARVWRMYLAEAELNDRDMVEGWKDGIDVLLVFAGLFSAVVTTFVAQTSQKLDQDYGQISASLLTEVIAIQRAVAAGRLVADVPPAALGFNSPPRYTTPDAWVNGLWFTSLALSLITALFSVLIKQWIQHYVSFVSGTPQERARVHQFRYAGLQRWKVHAIISVLPVLLYVALFLFIFGLVVFLQALKPAIAGVIGVLGGIAFVLYVATNGLPLFYPQCPYRTPLAEPINALRFFGIFAYRRLSFLFIHHIVFRILRHRWFYKIPLSSEQRDHLTDWQDTQRYTDTPVYESTALKIFEFEAAKLDQDKIVTDIIMWLLTMSSNPSVRPITLQALSGLRIGFSYRKELLGEGSPVRTELISELDRQTSTAQDFGNDPTALINSPPFFNTERIIRACMLMPSPLLGLSEGVWEPYNWEKFDQAVGKLEVNLALQHVLATYRIQSISGIHIVPIEQLSPMSIIAATANLYPTLWQAWTLGLKDIMSSYDRPLLISDAHKDLQPLYQAALEPGCSSESFDIVLPFLCQTLPKDLVSGHFDKNFERHITASDPMNPALHIPKIKFVIMLLYGIAMQWGDEEDEYDEADEDSYNGEIEDSIIVACGPVLKAICDTSSVTYDTIQDAIIPPLAAVLDELIAKQRFSRCRLKASSYHLVTSAYIEAYRWSWTPLAEPRALLSPEHVYAILARVDCASGLLEALFRDESSSPCISTITSQIVAALERHGVSDKTFGDLFNSFMDLSLTQENILSLDYSEFEGQWPPRLQPLLRCMLNYVIGHKKIEDSSPSLNTFATAMLERPIFLTFICSPFLVDKSKLWREQIVLGKESSVLSQLANYHRGKPGATDVWHRFLSWVQSWAVTRHDNWSYHANWTRVDFDKYERMAKLVDELARIIGLDDPQLKLPRFEESFIIEFLKQNGRPLFTSSPNTDPTSTSTKNHRAIDQTVTRGEVNSEDYIMMGRIR